MTVAELMQRNVKTVESQATLAEAIVSLADAHISGMLVVDGAGKVVGVLPPPTCSRPKRRSMIPSPARLSSRTPLASHHHAPPLHHPPPIQPP